ncbi:MAG: aminoglycoside phosphotransferase, partial [Pseudarthrobacter sp.]|nr:aminoglycoside phosphotransferase [Pseudarthrobacter sp.]
FNPCVVHGDLHEDNLLVDGDRVTAVTGWTDLRIGDPADDMAWLVASNEHDFVDAVLAHYTSSRRDAPDAHLLRRAALSAEFALAQYLVKGLSAGNQDMIREAESMLTALAEDVAEHGGQPISVEPLPQPVAPPAQAQPVEAAGIPVPAVSKVTVLAPDSVSGLPAAPSSSAMPAVQVTPIPLEEMSRADGGSEDGGGQDGGAQDGGAQGAAEGTSTEGTTGNAEAVAAQTAAADGATADAATADGAAGSERAEGEARETGGGAAGGPAGAGGTATPDAPEHPPHTVQDPKAAVVAADDAASTQSVSVVAAATAADTSTTALPVVEAKPH